MNKKDLQRLISAGWIDPSQLKDDEGIEKKEFIESQLKDDVAEIVRRSSEGSRQKTNEELHKELWGWLAETGSNTKKDWPGWAEIFPGDKALENNCFCCAEAWFDLDCGNCPVDWGEENDCVSKGTLFNLWYKEKTIEKRKILAAQIRDLPWNPR